MPVKSIFSDPWKLPSCPIFLRSLAASPHLQHLQPPHPFDGKRPVLLPQSAKSPDTERCSAVPLVIEIEQFKGLDGALFKACVLRFPVAELNLPPGGDGSAQIRNAFRIGGRLVLKGFKFPSAVGLRVATPAKKRQIAQFVTAAAG